MTSGAAPRRFACTYLSHALTRSSPHSFARDTEPRGLMPDGDGGTLRLGNCKLCGTTLAIVEPEARRPVDGGRL